MRENLKAIKNRKIQVVATFSRFGTKKNFHGYLDKTVLFTNVCRIDGMELTDHIWFALGKRMEELEKVEQGAKVKFFASIKQYRKGIDRNEIDYKLSNPSQFKIVG